MREALQERGIYNIKTLQGYDTLFPRTIQFLKAEETRTTPPKCEVPRLQNLAATQVKRNRLLGTTKKCEMPKPDNLEAEMSRRRVVRLLIPDLLDKAIVYLVSEMTDNNGIILALRAAIALRLAGVPLHDLTTLTLGVEDVIRLASCKIKGRVKLLLN